MRHTSRFTSPPVIGQFAEGTSEGPTKGGPPYSTSWSGIYGGIRPSEFTGGEPVHFFRNGLMGDTPQGRFGLPVSQFTTSACPVCGGVLESRGPFDGTQASSGVTGGHEGFGETFLCPDGHWFTQIQGATVPAERILTVIEPVGTDEAYKDALVTDRQRDILRDAAEFAVHQAAGDAWSMSADRTLSDMLYAYADALRDQILGDTGYLPAGKERVTLVATLAAANEMLGPDALDMSFEDHPAGPQGDDTAPVRKAMIDGGQPAADLAADPDRQWTTAQLQEEFEVLEFSAPFVVVRRKSDQALGSLEFTHSPRVYFGWSPHVSS
jgi:hypothetical protein